VVSRRRSKAAAIATALMLSLIGAAPAFENPQDRPALASEQAARSPLLSVARAGSRIVAVGLRGHIVFSDDMGQRWTQARVPVSSDLLAVNFPSARHGWAVGQGGVVLHSADAGASWTRQLEGRQAAEMALRHYDQTRAADPAAEALFKREQRLSADGGTQPFLDVHFESETHGFVVGTFNRIFRTEDGGATWTPWMDRTDNPGELHFYAMRGDAQGLYLAGEQGAVWRMDPASQRFVAVPTPYKGTLFGLVTDGPDTLLAFGMRGSLFRSGDRGRTWARVSTTSAAGITAGTVLADGSVLLVTQAGGIELSRDHGLSFSPVKPAAPMPYFGVTSLGPGRIGLVGADGVRLEPIRLDSSARDSGRASSDPAKL
jgi:photosystem II stability/assembly factor-like uncharacterized protein